MPNRYWSGPIVALIERCVSRSFYVIAYACSIIHPNRMDNVFHQWQTYRTVVTQGYREHKRLADDLLRQIELMLQGPDNPDL